jgi:pimeloyl-ACP methyl ester carboxylesterase
MNADVRRNWYWFFVLVAVVAVSALMAHSIERDFGRVEVKLLKIVNPDGLVVAAKLFRPVAATPDHPAPAVLNMHGYQNDKNVQDPFSIELARRGFVVLAPDSIGHGDSDGVLNVASWFADPAYVMGNEDALAYLATLPFVDPSNIGLMGHSMGTMNAVKLPALFPENVRAIDSQASLPGSPELPNFLVSQARYDEFSGFRENQPRTEELTSSETRLAALGLEGPIQWDTTYGSFDGTARRMALINMDHHLLPLTNKAVAEGIDWMRLALRGGNGGPMWIEPTQQIFMWKEVFGFLTLLGTLATLIPLTSILLATEYFKPVAQPLPKSHIPNRRTWWLFATINMLIGGILYPLTTQFGFFRFGSSGGELQALLPFMKLQMGNGVAVFFVANAVVAGVLFWNWYRGAKKQGVTMYDMGVSFNQEKAVIDWRIIGKTVLLAAILFLWMYLLEGFFQWAFGQEFRFAWPYMRQFGQLRRVGYFFIYLVPALLFFLVNGGVFLFGQIRQEEYDTPVKTQIMWWLKVVYAMVTGLFLVWAFQYVPWILLGKGPGFENVGLARYSGMWPLMLFAYIPEFVILFFFHTWFYRRTGRIYLGALVTSILAVWFLAAGSVIGQ